MRRCDDPYLCMLYFFAAMAALFFSAAAFLTWGLVGALTVLGICCTAAAFVTLLSIVDGY